MATTFCSCNSARGVMKLALDDIDSYESITAQADNIETDIAYETLYELRGVEQLAGFDDAHAAILGTTLDGSLELKTIPLP